MKSNITCLYTPVNQKDFEDTIVYSQAFPFDINCTNLLKQWKSAKKKFISRDGNTIYRSTEKFTFKTDKNSNEQNFNNFLKDIYCYTDDANFICFLKENKDTFFENKVSVAWPNYNIPVGAKLSKSFTKFFEDKNFVKILQDIASRYMQLTQVSGYLYLSVHPMDYLTLSENAANWSSCHSLDGDYRCGNLSYMVDNTTIVAYLATNEMQHFKCLPENVKWFSKKWRMLIHINTNSDIIYYNKQYPFEHKTIFGRITDMVHQIFFPAELRCVYDSMAFRKVETRNGPRTLPEVNFITEDKIFPASKVISSGTENSLFFNDLRHSASYLPIVDVPAGFPIGENTMNITIGKEPCCPVCGHHNSYMSSHNMLCNNCIHEKCAYDEFYTYCAECGHRIYPSDKAYEMDGITVCKSCYHSLKDTYFGKENK